MSITFNIQETVREVQFTIVEGSDDISLNISEAPVNVELLISETFNVGIPPAFEQKIAELENFLPINTLNDVLAGNLETVSIPSENPLVIGMVQQIDESDGNKVYYPNFTTTPDGRSAIFTSVLTQLQNKIVIWPRKPFT